MTFEECNDMVSEMNKLAPYQADEVTIFERASCTSYPTELIFNYKLTRSLSVYSEVSYLNYFNRIQQSVNAGINFLIL